MNKYITKEDYLKYAGVNLDLEVQDDDNVSEKVSRFIREVTDWCCDKLAKDYCCNELNRNLPDSWDSFPVFRKERFREGVMEQMSYMFDCGRVSRSPIINKDTGAVIGLENFELGADAYKKFFLGAFCNIRRG